MPPHVVEQVQQDGRRPVSRISNVPLEESAGVPGHRPEDVLDPGSDLRYRLVVFC